MASAEVLSPPETPVWHWHALAALLILTAAGLHVAWLAADCPLDLAPDEAHYWDWSRHLDWSYYSKGPLVAYLIRSGTLLVGPWAEQWTGNAMLAVRLPAVVCGSLFLLSLYVLTVQTYRDERLACAVVALMLTIPATVVMSSIMTIDAPYICCWGWALVLAQRAVFRESAWAWLLLGLIVGVGVLAKYTMVLFIPSLALFLLTSPEHRPQLWRPGFWLMSAVAGLCCLPILIWNGQHGWVTFKHVNGLAGLNQEATSIQWLGPLTYLGTQAALLLGFWFVAWLAAMMAYRPGREADLQKLYLWWLSAPMFVVFLLFAFKTGGGEPNWPVTAYVSGIVLTAGWLAEQLRAKGLWRRRLIGAGLASACVLGLGLSLLVHFSQVAHPAMVWLGEKLFPGREMMVRRFDPTCRLRGWQTLAQEVDRLRAELRSEGDEPVLAGTGWSLPGELGFYCEGQPTVYSIGLATGDRHSQYDFWRPNPMCDADAFRGKTFVIVGGVVPGLRDAFARVEEPKQVTHSVAGLPVASWWVTVCRGFRGFPDLAEHIGH
jgi:hypothetical protein